ncbi:TRAP transporter substrate-binding protein [Pusillimonas noertemannii]|uniref:TRAP transporter substrate-binding protein n=1 Tax=Pusillimonas noertemannii TaxID=305977 RepID=UPI0002DC1663|nr:TRAP transporter substrate-binding protein [Pusillimonas noertemannii]
MSLRSTVLQLAFAWALAFGGMPSAAGQTYELKASSYLPPSHTINAEISRWAKELEERSGGRLVIKLFTSGQMGPVQRQFDLARTGVADISYVLHGATPGRFPLTELAQYPTLIPNGRVGSQALMDIADLLQKEYRGVKVLYFMATPPIPFLMAREKITTLDQLQGLRIRHPGIVYASLISALGASPVGVAPAEVSDSLSKGTIDGTLMSYEGAQSFQLGNDVKYSLDVNAGVVTFALVMNPDSFSKLPPDLQALIEETTGHAGAKRVGTASDEADEIGLKYMKDHGLELTSLEKGDAQQYQKVTADLLEKRVQELEKEGVPAREVVARLKQAIAKYAKEP